MIEIYPGETAQTIHRDRWAWGADMAFERSGLELELIMMWALSPFTAANGATRVIPGSHRWAGDAVNPRKDQPELADLATGITAPDHELAHLGNGVMRGSRERKRRSSQESWARPLAVWCHPESDHGDCQGRRRHAKRPSRSVERPVTPLLSRARISVSRCIPNRTP